MDETESSTDPGVSADRLAELSAENRALTLEIDGLRRFLASTLSIASALDGPHEDSEILGLLEEVLDSTLFAIGAEGGSLLVPDDKSGDLVFALVRGDSSPPELIGTRIPSGKSIAGWVASHRQAAIVNNTRDDERFYHEVDDRIDHHTRAVVAAPLLGGGKLLGVIEMVNRQGGKLFTMNNQTLLTLMCRFAGELLYSLVREVDLSATVERSLAGPGRRAAPKGGI